MSRVHIKWKEKLITLFERRGCVMTLNEIFMSLYPLAHAEEKEELKKRLRSVLNKHRKTGLLGMERLPGYVPRHGLGSMFKNGRTLKEYLPMGEPEKPKEIDFKKIKAHGIKKTIQNA